MPAARPHNHPEASDTSSLSSIPAELTERPQWVVWRLESRNGKRPTKVPYDAKTSRKASSTNPQTWCDFATACAAVEQFDGMGFVFSDDDDLGGIDLDCCFNEGEIHADALALIRRCGTYAEISPSGTGIKVIGKFRCPTDDHKTGAVPWQGFVENGRSAEFAIFDRGRYFTITGETLLDLTQIVDCQDEIDKVVSELWGHDEAARDEGVVNPAVAAMTDKRLLTKARRAKNKEKFIELWNDSEVDESGSHSEGDLALCRLLAFWCGPDPERIQRLFLQSERGKRAKTQRCDYLPGRIKKALVTQTEFYDPDDDDANVPTDHADVADALTKLLHLGTVDLRVTSARIVGRGSRADAFVRLSNGEELVFKPLKPGAAEISAEVAAVTGAVANFKSTERVVVIALIRRLAELQDGFTDEDIARDWGRQFLQRDEIRYHDFDFNDPQDRWKAFKRLSDGNEWHAVVLRHVDGTLYIRTGWFNFWVRREDPNVGSNSAIARRMETVGWRKRGQSGRVTVHSSDRTKQLGWNFFIVPAGWAEDDV